MNVIDPVQIVVLTTIRPGRERDFEGSLHRFVQRAIAFPGQLGVEVIRPAEGRGSRRYGVVHRFGDQEALQAFRRSDVLQEWQNTAQTMSEGSEDVREITGLESWFTFQGKELQPIPQWKMAVATFFGVLPIALVLGPMLPAWNFLLRNIALNAIMVTLLTWVVMPILTRLFRGWLYPQSTGVVTKNMVERAPLQH